MLKIPVDVRSISFQAASEVTRALDFETRQQRVDELGQPVWQVQLLITDADGMSIERVRFASPTPPLVKVGQGVEVSGLIATPYVNGNRTALSLKALSVSAGKGS